MECNLIKKGLAVVVILLFIVVAFVPSINANNGRSLIDRGEAEVTVSHYNEDGTVDKTIVKLSKKKALKLAKQPEYINDPEKRFLLYKEYGLIPKNVTRGQLRQKMLSVAEQLGITGEKIGPICNKPKNERNGPDRWFAVNFLNAIDGEFIANYNLPMGLSMFTGTSNYGFNALGRDLLPSVDLFYAAFTPIGFYEFWDGELPDFHFLSLGAFLLVGFVGYVVSSPLFGLFGYMVGYAVASFAFGLIFMGLPSRR
ncbi:MAG: hypothetical protein JSW06_06370 [Thermoplasmatales archaeon]|nr:MAG: hypothetical protein JSW06_06370 [Thermoplasmatales archaeon]